MSGRAHWPLYGLLLAPASVLAVTALLVDPGGQHTSDHLASGTIAGSQAALVVLLAVYLRHRLGWLGIAVLPVVVGLVLESFGNIGTATAIWGRPWNDEQAAALGPAVAGFERGHSLAGWGDLLVVGGGLAFVIAMLVSARVGGGVAAAAGVLSLLPPWIIPALGTAFLLCHLAARRGARAPGSAPTDGAGPARDNVRTHIGGSPTSTVP